MAVVFNLLAAFLLLGAQSQVWSLAVNGSEKSNSLFQSTALNSVQNDSPTAANNTYCKKVVPGLLRMSQGVDIATLDLFADVSSPNGFRRTIFEYTCDVKRTWYDPTDFSEEYEIPDQVESIIPVPTGHTNIKTHKSEKMQQFKDSMAAKVSLKLGGGMFGSFSASAGYKQAQNQLLKTEKSITETSSSESAFQVFYNPGSTLRVSRSFQVSVEELPRKYADEPAKYDAFVESYGTHYFEMAKFGGFLYGKSQIEKRYMESTSERDLNLNLAASFKFFVQMDASAEMSQISEQSRENFQHNSDTEFSYFGGDGVRTKVPISNFMPWTQSISKNPWLFGGQVMPIENLIQDAEKRLGVRTAVFNKLAKLYLGDLRESYSLSSVEMKPHVAEKLKEIEQRLSNPNTGASDIETMNLELAQLFEELQKAIDSVFSPLDYRYMEFMRLVDSDRSCMCDIEPVKRSFGDCMRDKGSNSPHYQCKKYTISLLKSEINQLGRGFMLAGRQMNASTTSDELKSRRLLRRQKQRLEDQSLRELPRNVTIRPPPMNSTTQPSVVPTSDDKLCNKMVPGVARMAQGVDIGSLDLFPSDITAPSGFLRPIFDFTCNMERPWYDPKDPNLVYDVPDQVESVIPVPSGTLTIKSRLSEDMEQFKDSLAVKVEMSMSAGLFGSFSTSAGYKEAQEKLLKNKQSVSETSSAESAFQVFFNPSSILRLSKSFTKAVEELPAKYADDTYKYDSFVRTFGTHYFEMAKFGGFLYAKSELENQYIETSSKRDIELNLAASFKMFVKVDNSVELGQVGEQSRSQFMENSAVDFYYYGGVGMKTIDPDNGYLPEWKKTISQNPWLFAGQVKPIESLIADSAKRASVKTAVYVKLAKLYLGDFQSAHGLSNIKMTPEVETKLKEIEKKLANPSTGVSGLEQLNRDLAKLFDELQKIIDKQQVLNLDDRYQQWLREVDHDQSQSCVCDTVETGPSLRVPTFGECMRDVSGQQFSQYRCKGFAYGRLPGDPTAMMMNPVMAPFKRNSNSTFAASFMSKTRCS